MVPEKTQYDKIINGFSLYMGGMAIGWLTGLSVSPVIQTILASLVAVIVSISAALAGIKMEMPKEKEEADTTNITKPRILLDPLPIMLMVVGVAAGAALGVYARTNNWLGPRTNTFAEEWKDTGLKKDEIALRVFNSLYPPPASATTLPGNTPENPVHPISPIEKKEEKNTTKQDGKNHDDLHNQYKGVLFNVSLDECKRLQNLAGDELRREMASSSSEGLTSLAKSCKDDNCLKAGVKKACAKYKE